MATYAAFILLREQWPGPKTTKQQASNQAEIHPGGQGPQVVMTVRATLWPRENELGFKSRFQVDQCAIKSELQQENRKAR